MSENHAPSTAPAPRRDRTWLGLAVLALLIGVGAFSLHRADDTKPKDWLDDQLTYVPSGKMLKPMALDYDEAVADLIWIRGMMYFADAYLTGKSYKWLGHIIDVVTTLNPRLHQAYEFAGVVLTKEKAELPKTLRILDRGIGEFQNDWKLRLYAAMGHLTLDSNYTKAADLLKPIADQEEVPDHIKAMSARLIGKGGDRRLALAFLIDRYLETDNPISHELFVARMIKLFPEAGSRSEEDKKRVIRKVMQEAKVEPLAELLGIEFLMEYLPGTELSPKHQKLLKLLGE
jgi:hypothetical protein